MFPFVTESHFTSKNLKQQLSEALSYIEPFEVSLDNFDQFEHSKSCTMFLYSELNKDKIIEVQKTLVDVVPECDDLSNRSANGFHPHLTVGQFKNRVSN